MSLSVCFSFQDLCDLPVPFCTSRKDTSARSRRLHRETGGAALIFFLLRMCCFFVSFCPGKAYIVRSCTIGCSYNGVNHIQIINHMITLMIKVVALLLSRFSIALGFQTPNVRRYFDPKNIPKTPNLRRYLEA